MAPEGVCCRQRFRAKDVECSVGNLTGGKCCEQVILDEMTAARDVDEYSTLRKPGEEPGIQDALGLGGEWEEADEDFGAREERCEPGVAVKAFDPVDVLGRAAPARD